MIDCSCFLVGSPYDYKGKLWIYPVMVNEIISNTQFPLYKKILTITQDDIIDDFNKRNEEVKSYPTPFELLLNYAKDKEMYYLVKQAFFFFTHQNIEIIPEQKCILIGNISEKLTNNYKLKDLDFITEEEFFDFQNIIRLSCGDQEEKPVEIDEDPRIARIKALGRKRDRIKAKQQQGLKFETYLTAICCMGIGINPLNVREISYVALKRIISMYQDKEKYNIDTQALIAGAKIKPEYWVKDYIGG